MLALTRATRFTSASGLVRGERTIGLRAAFAPHAVVACLTAGASGRRNRLAAI